MVVEGFYCVFRGCSWQNAKERRQRRNVEEDGKDAQRGKAGFQKRLGAGTCALPLRDAIQRRYMYLRNSWCSAIRPLTRLLPVRSVLFFFSATFSPPRPSRDLPELRRHRSKEWGKGVFLPFRDEQYMAGTYWLCSNRFGERLTPTHSRPLPP